MPEPRPFPVPATAVRVWWGYRSPALSVAQFLAHLGGTFVPAATLMQPPVGLRAYVPAVLASDDLPEGVPQETALLAWDSPQAYEQAFGTLAERVYALTHAGVYDLTSSGAAFAAAFAGVVATGTPYALLDTPADWMTGTAYQLVVSVPAGPPLAELTAFANAFAAQPPPGASGAYLLAGAAYVGWWEVWSGQPEPAARAELAGLGDVVVDGRCVPTTVTGDLDAQWPGITVSAGDLMTMQFQRDGGTS